MRDSIQREEEQDWSSEFGWNFAISSGSGFLTNPDFPIRGSQIISNFRRLLGFERRINILVVFIKAGFGKTLSETLS